MDAVRSLAHPGELVKIHVDNSVAFSYLKKSGGRLPHFNHLMRPFLRWCLRQKIQIQLELVTSQEQLADGLSRPNYDNGNYTLSRKLFLQVQKVFCPWVRPEIDMFASPGNFQLRKFITRHPHWQAWGVDALQCPLEGVGDCYANPPWAVIGQWLHRLHPSLIVRCLTVLF